MVTACCDGTARIWDLTIPERSPEQWKQLLELLSGHHIDQTQGMTPLGRDRLGQAWTQWRASEPGLFQVSGQRALAWHRDELEQAQKTRDPAAAVVHLDALIAQQPKDADLWFQRGRALGELRQWPAAEENLLKAKHMGNETLAVVQPLLLVQLQLEKKEAYRHSAEDIARSFLTSSDPAQVAAALRSCLTGPDALSRWDDVVAAAEKLAEKKTDVTGQKALLGAAYYRAGKLDEAFQKLTEASKTASPGDFVWTSFFLALVLQKQGKTEVARQAFDKAIDLLEGRTPGPVPRRRPLLSWTSQLEFDLLRAEVERTLPNRRPPREQP
jgi:tetratricopeptide (TPR) repeat protein